MKPLRRRPALTLLSLALAGLFGGGCYFEPFSDPVTIPANYTPQSYATPVYVQPTTRPLAVASPTSPTSTAPAAVALTQPVIDDRARDEIVAAARQAIATRFGVDADAQLNDYLVLVGSLITINTPKPDVEYSYLLLKTDQPIACAVWPRTICVSRGMLAQMQDESELAGVIAREISNLLAARSLKATGLPTTPPVADATSRPTTQPAPPAGRAVAINRQSAKLVDLLVKDTLGSEMDEAADVEGAKFAAAAKYAPDGYLRLLTRLRPAAATPDAGATTASANVPASTNTSAEWDRVKALHANVEIIAKAFPQADVRLPARFEDAVKAIKSAANR